MLSMKTLRVALVAALLAVPGLALAQSKTYVLDNPAAPPPVLQYALETMSTDVRSEAAVRSGRTVFSKLQTPGNPEANTPTMDEARIDPGVLLEDDGTWYLRVALDGMVFSDNVMNDDAEVYGTTTSEDDAEIRDDTAQRAAGGAGGIQVVSGGDSGDSSVIFRLDVVSTAKSDWIFFDFTDNLAAPKRAGDYGMSMSVHSSSSDANSGENPVGNTGSATLVRTHPGLNVRIHAYPNIAADVATGFLWFVNPLAPSPRNAAQVDLGYAIVTTNEGTRSGEKLLDASTGMTLIASALLTSPVTMAVTGDLSIGAFSIQPGAGRQGAQVSCEERGRSESAPNSGTLVDSEGNNIRRSGVTDVGLATGLETDVEHHLCVDVDVTGPETNSRAIARQTFSATLSALTPADVDDPEILDEGVIGRIGRNGASANIAYLTTSDKHNQRLIVVNRGSSPINVSDVVFQTEDGTDVEMTALAEQALEAMLGPGESITMRVGDMLNITGDSRRTAATISFRGVKENISVATTQVNLEDSSTDTVVWEVE